MRVVLVLLALACAPAWAGLPETPRLRQLSVADGLPSNIVYDVAEDAEGYLWFATVDGLARYGGAGFRIWRREDGLGDNEIDSLFVDADNRLWIGTETAGVVVLDAQRRNFTRIESLGGISLLDSPVWDITRTPDGSMWFGTAGAGLYRQQADGKVDHFLPGLIITSLEQDAAGQLWVGSNAGALRWTGSGFQPVLAGEYVIGLVPDHDGRVWVRTPGQGSVFDRDGKPLPLPQLPSKALVHGAVLQDREGAYWLNTDQGLTQFDGETANLASAYSNLTRGRVRPQYERALVDRDGGLWFGSQDSGVWHLPSNWRRFSVLASDSPAPSTLHNLQVFGVAASRGGNMWLVGTSGVLDELDPETGQVHARHRSQPKRVYNSVLEDDQGKVWIGGSAILVRFDPATGAMRHWDEDSGEDATFADDLSLIAQDGDGRIWVWMVGAGVQQRDRQGKRLESIALGSGRGLETGLIARQLRAGPQGAMWLAGNHGLLQWDAPGQRFVPVPGAPTGAVDGFDVDAEGRIWLLRSGAVEAYACEGGVLTFLRRIGAEAGLPQVAFRSVTVDRRGVLWLASLRGLVRLDPQDARGRIYGLDDGLPGQEILTPAVPRAGDGRLLVAASHGVALFDPGVVRPSSKVPQLAIERLRTGHGEEADDLPADGFALDHDVRDLHVVVRLMSFDNVSGHRYRFRLSGFDEGWVETGNLGERTFSRLAPGRYRLEVAGRTADGVWSAPRAVAFSVRPPWWRSWWAWALYAGLAVAVLWGAGWGYRYRIKRRSALRMAEHQRQVAEEASLAKTRFLATLGHEVRTPMTGVLGMAELLLGTPLDGRQRGYAQSIQNAGSHLLRLVNDALDLARIEAGKLQLERVDFDLHALVDEVAAMVAPLARQRGLQFDQAIAAGTPRALHGDPVRVRQILLNLLGNAIKFTAHGRVGLQVSGKEGGGVRFIVSDTGPGLSDEQCARLFRRFEQGDGARTAARYGGSGLGLAICQELAVAMGGSIGVDSAPGSGTRFSVDLPLPAAARLPPAPPTVAASPSRILRILLVEDDATVADAVTGLLEARGHRVTHAAHGLAALSESALQPFDVALLDLDLPGIDGLTLARQLRALGFSAPLLAVTARADADAEPEARAAGFDGFVRKPLTTALLVAAIEALPWREPA